MNMAVIKCSVTDQIRGFVSVSMDVDVDVGVAFKTNMVRLLIRRSTLSDSSCGVFDCQAKLRR